MSSRLVSLLEQLADLDAALLLIDRVDETLFRRAVVGSHSMASLIRDLADVEDNWLREELLRLPPRHPFGMRAQSVDEHTKQALVSYARDVRASSLKFLAAIDDARLDEQVESEVHGPLTLWQLWAGIAASGSWHCRQIARAYALCTVEAESA
jgi:hypothetical protein